MENNQTMQNQIVQTPPSPMVMSQEQVLLEILENSRKTRNFIKWQLYITVVLVVLPLLAMIVLIPMVMRTLSTMGSIYGAGGLLQ